MAFPFGDRSTDIYVQVYDHASPRVVLLKDGSAFAMYEVDGLPAQTLDVADLYRGRKSLNHGWTGLSSTEGLTLFSWVCRGFAPDSVYPSGVFRSRFAHDLNERYRAKLMDRFLYLNKTYVGVMLQPSRPAGDWVHRKLKRFRRERDITDETPVERIRRLMRVCDILQADLEPYKPRRSRSAHRERPAVQRDRRGAGLRHDGRVAFDRAAIGPSHRHAVQRADHRRPGNHRDPRSRRVGICGLLQRQAHDGNLPARRAGRLSVGAHPLDRPPVVSAAADAENPGDHGSQAEPHGVRRRPGGQSDRLARSRDG